jgi:hypothetical protein
MARFTAQEGDKVRQITSGIVHIQRVTDDPIRMNLLLFDLTAPEFDLKTGLGDGWLSGRYRTSQIAQQNKAIAAINGDLFSGIGVPQGLTIVDGKVVIAPKYRAAFAWSNDRQPVIGYFTDGWTWDAQITAENGQQKPLSLLNTDCPENQICLFNRFVRSVPERLGDLKVALDPSGVVTRVVAGSALRVPTNTQVLQATGTAATWLRTNLKVGSQATITINSEPALSNFRQAIGGGPVLLKDGRYVEDCLCNFRDCSEAPRRDRGKTCEEFPTDWKIAHYYPVVLPRTVIGYDQARETLIVAVIDGYQRGYSRGMNTEELADLMLEFGAYEAMEFDSGGSATMYLDGEVVNRPPDNSGERYVANALLFFWNEQPKAR